MTRLRPLVALLAAFLPACAAAPSKRHRPLEARAALGCAAAPTSRAVVLNETVLDELVLWGRGGPSYADVAQGAGASCYFLASLAAFARARPEAIRDAFKYSKAVARPDGAAVTREGHVIVRLFLGGVETRVAVDDFVPISTSGAPVFGRFRRGVAAWALLMEKAFAKVHGTYLAISTGTTPNALSAILPAPVSMPKGRDVVAMLRGAELHGWPVALWLPTDNGSASGDVPMVGHTVALIGQNGTSLRYYDQARQQEGHIEVGRVREMYVSQAKPDHVVTTQRLAVNTRFRVRLGVTVPASLWMSIELPDRRSQDLGCAVGQAALSLRFFVAGDPKGAGVQFANVSTETGMGFILRNCAGLVIEGTLTAPDAPWLEAVALVVYSPGEVTVSYKDALAVESALPPAWTFDAQLGAPTALREASEEECRRRAGRLPTLGDVKEVAAGRPDAAFPPKASKSVCFDRFSWTGARVQCPASRRSWARVRGWAAQCLAIYAGDAAGGAAADTGRCVICDRCKRLTCDAAESEVCSAYPATTHQNIEAWDRGGEFRAKDCLASKGSSRGCWACNTCPVAVPMGAAGPLVRRWEPSEPTPFGCDNFRDPALCHDLPDETRTSFERLGVQRAFDHECVAVATYSDGCLMCNRCTSAGRVRGSLRLPGRLPHERFACKLFSGTIGAALCEKGLLPERCRQNFVAWGVAGSSAQ